MVLGMLKHTKENRDWTPKGWLSENEEKFMQIGRELGCKFLIATGSRAVGNHIDTSDYDFIIVDDVSSNAYYRSKEKDIENNMGVRLDFIVSDKIYPSHGVMLEIKVK
jgi:hypothetical protein